MVRHARVKTKRPVQLGKRINKGIGEKVPQEQEWFRNKDPKIPQGVTQEKEAAAQSTTGKQ